jgi:catechol 2,3-dioxygenase-like lactoylglutathione lyase family enzyme
MFQNVEHIGIAVKDLAKAEDLYSRFLKVQTYKIEILI